MATAAGRRCRAGAGSGDDRSKRGAAGRGELYLAYQLIVDAGGGQIVGVEALLRWTHPSPGPVAPSVFIPFAEQSGQILELGRWVLQRACSDRRQWLGHRSPEVAISVNATGYSSLGYLHTLPIDTLKVDRTFVALTAVRASISASRCPQADSQT